jgi:hypothetical protein
MRPWESLRRRATTGGTVRVVSASSRVAGRAARRSLASGGGCSRRCKGIEIQPEARRIGAAPKLVSGLIAVLQTQNPLGAVRRRVTRGRLALFARVRLVAGHSGSIRSSPSGSFGCRRRSGSFGLRIARIGPRSTARMPGTVILSPRSPGAAHGSRKRLDRSWMFWRAIGGRTQRVYTVIGTFARAASMTGRNRARSSPRNQVSGRGIDLARSSRCWFT